MVRYYGHYSNKARGLRKKAQIDEQIPYILEPELSPKEFRRNWARLIQKIYEVDPLVCSRCQGSMRVIAFIEDEDVIKKILKHLGLWEVKHKPSPRANAPPFISDSYPMPSVDDYVIDPDYPVEAYFQNRRTWVYRLSIAKFRAFRHNWQKCLLDIMPVIGHINSIVDFPYSG
ncbi:MAG: hypothetical protein H8D96_20105 [Desulfobacterales bacterium]|uniref:Transposase n=1 Tax=Candidatus Desulfatibia vada TaxID=2841696 RepID=A0A8J6NVP7_9BACT|nr:hypothetical protein [Candidatus Desulfatibia vada]